MDVTKNFRGCDSLILYRVTIVNVDDVVTLNGSLLTARNSTGTYQWLNCTKSYQVIAGETGKQLIAKENHLFAVEITDGGCKDTSDCIQVTTASTDAFASSGIWISPNPSEGRFVIHSTIQGAARLSVVNSAGQIVCNQTIGGLNGHVIELKQPAGMYILRIETESGVISQRIGISE
jgi:hypothetical protein